jgi:hypothetical protein
MSKEKAGKQETVTGEPVPGFPLKFTWMRGDWEKIFDLQRDLIKSDIARVRAEGRLVFYLSCPISSRGGGWSGTNVDIARHVERSMLERWGEAFWVLNPAQYQLESKAGTGLIVSHAERLKINLEDLLAEGAPGGGDYLRMWTRVLVEDAHGNLGRDFDAFYFLGPRDVFSFFTASGSETLTAGVQAYFARKMESDIDFRDKFSVPTIDWGDPVQTTGAGLRENWMKKRADFLRFYAMRASASFSLGSHDEWAILNAINAARRKVSTGPGMLDGDTGDQLAAFFDGTQVSIGALQSPVSRGYAV